MQGERRLIMELRVSHEISVDDPPNARHVHFERLYRIDRIDYLHGSNSELPQATNSPFHTASQDCLIDTIFQRC